MIAYEVNFDGLVGPTHNYAGLSFGNLPSERHKGAKSNPRGAALQGLEKMKLVAGFGVKQAVLPPQHRPELATLRALGFTGSDSELLTNASGHGELLAACWSASAMWSANAATVSPSADSTDNRCHFTPANLCSNLHRVIEVDGSSAILRCIFKNPDYFVHHDPLPSSFQFSDEGAANHMRLCAEHGSSGIQMFVYGRSALGEAGPATRRYPARQTLESSSAIARLHRLDSRRTIFAQQNPAAIDAGVFHNDVIAVANQNVLLCHDSAFHHGTQLLEKLKEAFAAMYDRELITICISDDELPIDLAVQTYLFNSQLLSMSDQNMVLVCPQECIENRQASKVLDRIVNEDNPLRAVHPVDIRQSMSNGGGPACLRLRVVLSGTELAAIHQGVVWSEGLYQQLQQWIRRHYREQLSASDLQDTKLMDESMAALDELTQILMLGPIYQFQRDPLESDS